MLNIYLADKMKLSLKEVFSIPICQLKELFYLYIELEQKVKELEFLNMKTAVLSAFAETFNQLVR